MEENKNIHEEQTLEDVMNSSDALFETESKKEEEKHKEE